MTLVEATSEIYFIDIDGDIHADKSVCSKFVELVMCLNRMKQCRYKGIYNQVLRPSCH